MYLVYDENSNSNSNDNSNSTGTMIGQAAINALVIVSVICGATFILVACYYFRCLKLMIGYLIFACANLLGYTGGFMVYTAIQRYQIIFDWVTLAFIMYNFAIGGVVAVFWQKGVPRMMTQTYLVAVSVIMAWILSELPEWTSWALLIALALYDLCAVLTPCGPLRALVHLAQERRDPIPGLLYEADVNSSSSANDNIERSRDTLVPPVRVTNPSRTQLGRGDNAVPLVAAANGYESTGNSTLPVWERPVTVPELLAEPVGNNDLGGCGQNNPEHVEKFRRIQNMTNGGNNNTSSNNNAQFNSVSNPAFGTNRNALTPTGRSTSSSSSYHQTTIRSLTHPGTLDHSTLASSTEYTVLPSSSSSSYTKVNIPGPPSHVQEWPPSYGQPREPSSNNNDTSLEYVNTIPNDTNTPLNDEDEEIMEEEMVEEEERNIKLGLGDFVFYSVLVSRAAMYDISTAAACFISVIMGLGGTLFLLGIFKKALPALPISIFLGVTFYFITRLVITPMITELIVGGTEIVQ